jgi:hypothetical protein
MKATTIGKAYRYDGARNAAHGDRLARIERIAAIMDTAFAIPGTRIRFGADSIIGLAPGVGDAVTTAVSAYLIYEAHKMGLPKHKLLRMGGNVVLDAMVGAVPLLGDVADVFFRANRRNLKIVRDHFADLEG